MTRNFANALRVFKSGWNDPLRPVCQFLGLWSAFSASPLSVWLKVLLWFSRSPSSLQHVDSLVSQVHVQHSASARARLYLYSQYENTRAAFAYFGMSTVQRTVAVVDGQQIIFFANRQNFSFKMFAGSVALKALQQPVIAYWLRGQAFKVRFWIAYIEKKDYAAVSNILLTAWVRSDYK